MHKFNPGDLVRHKMLGYVLPYIITVKHPVQHVVGYAHTAAQLQWDADDCEPVTDEQPVNTDLYEAAKSVVYEWERKGCPITSLGIECANLRDAITNSKPVEPQGWITDRRPTEDDAWNGCIVIYYRDSPGVSTRMYLMDWRVAAVMENIPWQPVPQCLRTPPKEQPKCETCEHYRKFTPQLVSTESEHVDSYFLEYCHLTDKTEPTHGMNGCDYKLREE